MSEINKVNVKALLDYKKSVEKDSSKADRNPKMIANWIGGDRSRVDFGDISVTFGGENEMNPMQMLLATLASCDVDLIATHASILGLKIENLSVEVSGHFNVQAYLGLENVPGSGYDSISYTVNITAPNATSEQIDYLRKCCERSSPVGDSLTKKIPLKLKFKGS